MQATISDLLVKAGSKRPIFEIMENRDEVSEDDHQCYYCTDFAYLSMI